MAENLDQVSGLLRDALILVTGAGQGNGRAIALGVAAAGAKVIVTDVRQDTAQSAADEIQARGGKAIRLPTRRHGCGGLHRTCQASRRRGRSRQCPGQQCRHHYSRDDR